MSKKTKIYFLTSYVEFLMEQGIRSEEYYLGDASRFLRHLLAAATPEDLYLYIHNPRHSPSYRRRLEKTLRKFFIFAEQCLAIPESPRFARQKEPDHHLVPK